MQLNDALWNHLESRMGITTIEKAVKYSKADWYYREALESVSLALQGKGMAISDILEVLDTALDAYENNAC